MRRVRILFAVVAFVVVLLPRVASAASAAPADPCAGYRRGTAVAVAVPSRTIASIQSAVCQVRDNGTVFVLPGSYAEQISVIGKHVHIVGLGSPQHDATWPVIRAATPVRSQLPNGRATVTVGDRGGLSLRMIRLSGGDTQIRVTGRADSLTLSQTQLTGGWDGVVHDSPSASLTIRDASIIGQKHDGISVNPGFEPGFYCTIKMLISGTFFGQQANVAIRIRNCEPAEVTEGEGLFVGLLLQNLELQGQGAGGLLVINSGPFNIGNIHIHDAATFGIAAVGSDLSIHDSLIENTVGRPSDGLFGDGIVELALGTNEPGGDGRQSNMIVLDTQLLNNARAGISNFGSFMTMKNVTVQVAVCCALDGEQLGGFSYQFENLGGMMCKFPGYPWGGCVVESSQLQPPDSLVEPM